MKSEIIKKTLIIQTIIVVIAFLVIAIPAFFIDNFYELYNEKIKTAKEQGGSLAGQVSALNAKYIEANNGIIIYNEIKQKQDDKKLTVNKFALQDAIAEARKNYIFNNFDVDMGDVKPREGAQYNLKTILAEASIITIKMDAISDLDIFLFIQSLESAFPAAHFSSMKLTLTNDLGNDTLVEIKKSGFSPLVKGEFAFTWSGLKDVKTEDAQSLLESKTPPKGAK